MRKLGKSGIEVSDLGLGCWSIGGPWHNYVNLSGQLVRMGKTNDRMSFKAIDKALYLGINFFDTAEGYGEGHSEVVLGQRIKRVRDRVVIASKIANVYNERTKKVSPELIRKACHDSLRRLGTDYIDLYQLHLWSTPLDDAAIIFSVFDKLKKEGLIREYGWSTDNPDCIDFLVHKTKSISIQHHFNVFVNAKKILDICEKYNIASINRTPLAMGLLSGKYNKDSKFGEEDFRGHNIGWVMYFKNGKPNKEFLKKLNSIRNVLTADGRSLIQGAIGWIWAKSEKTIPIPGFRTVKQVEEIAKAIEFGPLAKEQMIKIDRLITKILIQ